MCTRWLISIQTGQSLDLTKPMRNFNTIYYHLIRRMTFKFSITLSSNCLQNLALSPTPSTHMQDLCLFFLCVVIWEFRQTFSWSIYLICLFMVFLFYLFNYRFNYLSVYLSLVFLFYLFKYRSNCLSVYLDESYKIKNVVPTTIYIQHPRKILHENMTTYQNLLTETFFVPEF